MVQSIEVDKVLLDTDFIVEHKKSTDHKMDRPHFHDGYEIHYACTKDVFYYIEEQKYKGEIGTVALFNSQEIHRVVPKVEGIMYERYYILFKPRFLEFATSSYPDLLMLFTDHFDHFENFTHLDAQEQIQFLNLLNQLLLIQNGDNHYFQELKLKQKLLEILLLLNDSFMSSTNRKTPIRYNKQGLLKEITQYIRKEFGAELSIASIADHFFISKSTLTRLFVNHLGMTPNEYITYVRIMESRKLLSDEYSVQQVAIKVGYKDQSSFIKVFKRLQGISPKQYALEENRRGK